MIIRPLPPPAPHTHAWDTAWSSDATNHWHACTGAGATNACLNEAGAAKAAHTYGDAGDARFTCTVCQYVDAALQAAAALADAKAAAANTVNAVDPDAYIADDRNTVVDAKVGALDAIENAATEDAVAAALNTFNTAIAGCTTQAALEDAQTAAKAELDALLQGKDDFDYDPEDWVALTQAIYDGKDAIDEAATIDAVTAAKNGVIETVNAIQTTAEKLADAKTAAKAELDALLDGKDMNDYDSEDWNALTWAIYEGKDNIDNEISVEGVEATKNDVIETVNAIQTKAEKLADAKTAAKAELDALLESKDENDYDPVDWAVLNQAIADGKDDIDNENSVEDVEATKNCVIEAVNAIQTTAEQLAAAKTAAANTVNGVDENGYIPADQATVVSAKVTALAAIEAATTEDEVTAALNTFSTAIAGCTLMGDEPSAIEATVTFQVVNGSWDDETTGNKTVTLTGVEGDTLKLTADQIPAVGGKPNDGYQAGSWDVTPDTDTAITENTTYTYTYAQAEATVEIIGGKCYIDGELAKGAGLVLFEGSYYYVKTSGEISKNVIYSVKAAKTNDLLPAGTYEFGEDGRMIIKNGVIDGRYYVNGRLAKGAGLVLFEGSYYYVKLSGEICKNVIGNVKAAKTNGLLPAGTYEFGEDGRMIIKNGIIDGCYYVNGRLAKGAGLVLFEGSYYYVKTSGEICKNVTGYVSAAKTNGLIAAGRYQFDADGKLIL